jgi:hypothetical protein
VVKAGKLDSPGVRQRLSQVIERWLEEIESLAPAEQQHVGLDLSKGVQRPRHLGQEHSFVVQCRRQAAHGYVTRSGLLVLTPQHHARERLEQPPRDHLHGWRCQFESDHARDERGRHLTLGHLPIEPGQPLRVPRAGREQGRLIHGDFADSWAVRAASSATRPLALTPNTMSAPAAASTAHRSSTSVRIV